MWVDLVWGRGSVFAGIASAALWRLLEADAETALFFAGEAVIELHRTETNNYRDNLGSGAPALGVIMRPTASDPPYELLAGTADPAEGETFTDAGMKHVAAFQMPSAI